MNTLPIEKRYRPSSGNEGIRFMARFCEKCKLQSECEIHFYSMSFDKKDDEYPEEWTYDSENKPICTEFQEIN